MLFFLVFPGLFVAGLVIMPIGVWLAHRRRRGRPKAWLARLADDRSERGVAAQRPRRSSSRPPSPTSSSCRWPRTRASSTWTRPQFCGQLCHEVMEPEWAGYQEGAHSRVACVQCHIGPGAPWFVKSKISGLRQVYAVTFNTHSRPIPVAGARPASGPGHLRAVPLAREVPRRQDPDDPELRRRRGQHRVGDDAADAHRRDQPARRPPRASTGTCRSRTASSTSPPTTSAR